MVKSQFLPEGIMIYLGKKKQRPHCSPSTWNGGWDWGNYPKTAIFRSVNFRNKPDFWRGMTI